MIDRQIGKLVRAIDPRLWLLARHSYFSLTRRLERELKLMDILVPRGQMAIDIGANRGIYTYVLRRFASKVIAFEPIPDLAEDLRELLGPDVEVIQVALSDRAGTVVLRIPVVGDRLVTGLATVVTEDTLANMNARDIEVRAAQLDDFNLTSVGFVKIDVEGHEGAVLAGAVRTIERERPRLLIEMEERYRHNAVADTVAWLRRLDYRGFFVRGARVVPVEKFDGTVDQRWNNDVQKVRAKRAAYINNFIFVPAEGADKVQQCLEQRIMRNDAKVQR